MEKTMMKMTSYFVSYKRRSGEKIRRFFRNKKYVSGVTVIELVLILVRNFTPYLGCVLCGLSGNVWTNLTRYIEKGGKCVCS